MKSAYAMPMFDIISCRDRIKYRDWMNSNFDEVWLDAPSCQAA